MEKLVRTVLIPKENFDIRVLLTIQDYFIEHHIVVKHIYSREDSFVFDSEKRWINEAVLICYFYTPGVTLTIQEADGQIFHRRSFNFKTGKFEAEYVYINTKPFEAQYYIPVSTAGGYDIEFAEDMRFARLRDSFGLYDPVTTSWYQVTEMDNPVYGADFPQAPQTIKVINPSGFNINIDHLQKIEA